MADTVMKYGARPGSMNVARRWIAKATAGAVCIFPVPGADVLRAYNQNNDTEFKLAGSPREANVLLVMGDLSENLAQKAAIVYAQIPRPRVLVLAGTDHLSPLPKPDIQISLSSGFLTEVLPQVRKLLQHHAWKEDAEPWEPDFLEDIIEDDDDDDEGGHDHHHHHNHEHDEHADGGDEEHEQHDDSHDHGDEQDEANQNHSDDEGDEEDDDGGMDMDFMSMVMMTKDLPRPKDGLPMNRSEAHFGPFHPGLPGGLSVFTELDGDTVIKAHVEHGLFSRNFASILPIKPEKFPDFLSWLNPLSPQSYKLLAQKALESSAGGTGKFSDEELAALEKERIASHLNWLASFAKTSGNEWMHRQAAAWYAQHQKAETNAAAIKEFLNEIRKMPYLQNKLTKGNSIPENLLHHLSGPVARAAGQRKDARLQDERYRELGWEPAVNQENNAWGRLMIRLDEMEQSLQLIEKAQKIEKKEENFAIPESEKGSAQIESPRGSLSLEIAIEDGMICSLKLKTPSKILAGLVNAVAKESELSDALVEIASLDISPWEMEFKNAEVEK